MSDPTQGGNGSSMSIEELEVLERQPQNTDLSKIQLDGESVPEGLRGKSVNDVISRMNSMEEALRLSEQARKQAETNAQLALSRGGEPQKPAEEETAQELSEEQIKELYEEDPIKAIQVINDQALRRAEKNLEIRLAPMMRGTSAQVEQAVRSKYADEFELFGDQITQLAGTVPNKEAVLSNPAAWDDLIALVRGRQGNMEKLIARKSGGHTPTQAREMQTQTMGFTGTGGPRQSASPSNGQLDPIQKEIAEKMNMSEAEYIKWMRVSS